MADFENKNESGTNNTQTAEQGGWFQDSDNSNMPRLRKIKRPKTHQGPITDYNQPVSGSFVTNTAQNAQPQGQSAEIQPPAINRAPVSSYNENYAQQPDEYDNESYYEHQTSFDMFMARLDAKKFVALLLGCFFVGLVFGKLMFSSEQVVRNGLQGVVINPEVPQGRSRCGVAEKTQGCVLYVMNPQRQDLNGRDFYDLASQLTGRQRFVIETGNMRYSSVKIKPGNIAQLNIPPLQ